MDRYAAAYLGFRHGELDVAPDPAVVGCDTNSAAVARSVVEQALREAVAPPES